MEIVISYFWTQPSWKRKFAPAAKATTSRIMVALAKFLELHLHQLDVDSALEIIQMEPTLDIDIERGYCLKLQKSLDHQVIYEY